MIDGVDVPVSVTTGGTNPTALIQAGNLNIGARNARQFFPGKIAQAAVFSAKVTQAQMQAYYSQGLTGTETSLISAYSFNNSLNDLNANANNLTANGSAVATNADSPFAGGANASTAYTAGTTEFGEVFNVSFSTNTTIVVQVPDGYLIPTSGGVSALAYSTQASPLGWPEPGGIRTISAVVMGSDEPNVNATETLVSQSIMSGYVPAGRKIRISGWLNLVTTAAGSVVINLKDGATTGSANLAIENINATAGVRFSQYISRIITNTSAGSRSFALTIQINANAVAVQGGTIGKSDFSLEIV